MGFTGWGQTKEQKNPQGFEPKNHRQISRYYIVVFKGSVFSID